MRKLLLPKHIIKDNITLKKVSLNNDFEILEEIYKLYNENTEHLIYWHHNIKSLLFKNNMHLRSYLEINKLTCYAIYYENILTGYFEIGRLFQHNKQKYRSISFWIDKNYIRKGIMYNALIMMEVILREGKVNILTANVDMANKPSINLMEKLNFKNISASFLISENGESIDYYTFEKNITETEEDKKNMALFKKELFGYLESYADCIGEFDKTVKILKKESKK